MIGLCTTWRPYNKYRYGPHYVIHTMLVLGITLFILITVLTINILQLYKCLVSSRILFYKFSMALNYHICNYTLKTRPFCIPRFRGRVGRRKLFQLSLLVNIITEQRLFWNCCERDNNGWDSCDEGYFSAVYGAHIRRSIRIDFSSDSWYVSTCYWFIIRKQVS